jgi:hypothetical protein
LYEENHIELDSEGSKMLKDQAAKIEQLTEENANLINDKMELNKVSEKAAKKIRIIEATKGLDDNTVGKVELFFESKDFSNVDEKVDNYVQMLVEESNEVDNKKGEDEKKEKNLDENTQIEGDDNQLDTDELNKPKDESADKIKRAEGLL